MSLPRPLLAVMLACLACTGCASSASSPAAASPQPSASASGSPYRIGLLTSLTGPSASLGTAAQAAITMEAEAVNAGGGVDGHPIQVIVQNDHSDPSAGKGALEGILAQQLIAELGPVDSDVALAVAPLEQQAGLPSIHLGFSGQQVQPDIFVAAPSSDVVAQAIASYLRRTEISTAGVLVESGAYGSSVLGSFKQAAPGNGIRIAASQTYQKTGTDMTAQLNNIKQTPGVQALVVLGSGGNAATIAQEAQQLSLGVPLIFTPAQEDGEGFIKVAGSGAEGAVLPSTKIGIANDLLSPDPSAPLVESFGARFHQATGIGANVAAGNAYDAFHILVAALQRAGGPDHARVTAAIGQTEYLGVNGTYRFSAGNHAGLQPPYLAIAHVQDGELRASEVNCDACLADFETKG